MTVRLVAEARDRRTGMTLAELGEFVDRTRALGLADSDLVKAKVTMRGRIRELTFVSACDGGSLP